MKFGVWLAVCVALGCAQEHERQPAFGTAGASGQGTAGHSGQAGIGQAGQGQAGQGGQGGDPQTRALILELLDQFDRQAMGLCRCQVGWGDFPTVEACFAMIGSNDSWRTCFLDLAAKSDFTGIVPFAECERAQFKARADCFDAMSMCTKANVGDCTGIDTGCTMVDPQALLPLVAACPQTILLH